MIIVIVASGILALASSWPSHISIFFLNNTNGDTQLAMEETMTLIAGRSSKQGTSLNSGKLNEEYQKVTSTLEMNEEDMARLDVNEGDKLRISNEIGDTIVTCARKKATDLPGGMIFIPYGPHSSKLMASDTAGSGMPLSKIFTVKVEKAES